MQVIRGLVVVCLALALVSTARADAKKDIVGKWEMKQKINEQEVKIEIEYKADGKMSMSFMGLQIGGSYKVKSDTELEMTIEFMGQSKTDTVKIKVTKDSLEITDKNGKVDKLTRVK